MYAIDRIENNIIIAEELNTKKRIELKEEGFPFQPKEGLLFSIKNNQVIEEKEEQAKRRKILREKFERLKHYE